MWGFLVCWEATIHVVYFLIEIVPSRTDRTKKQSPKNVISNEFWDEKKPQKSHNLSNVCVGLVSLKFRTFPPPSWLTITNRRNLPLNEIIAWWAAAYKRA